MSDSGPLIVDGQIIEAGYVISEERPQQCDLCGKLAELRPYGPHGEHVCFDCGMKDEPAAARAFASRLEGDQS